MNLDRLSDYRAKLQARINAAVDEYYEAAGAAQDDHFTNDDARDAYCFLSGLQEAMEILDLCDGRSGKKEVQP